MKLLYLVCLLLSLSPLYGEGEKKNCNFTPIFYGTLLEFPSLNNLPGQITLEPYLYGGFSYGVYDNNWSLIDVAQFGLINPLLYGYIGVTKSLQLNFILQSQTIFFKDHSKTHLGDTSLGATFQFLWEEKNTSKPNLCLSINESFPTGKYKNLNPSFSGNDSTGSGSYGTSFIFILGKTFYTNPCHPFNLAFNLVYTYFTKTNIHGITTYGGGPRTHGKILPGGPLLIDFSIQYCFTQKYIFALDIQYTHTFPAKFDGVLSFNPDGTVASILTASKDLFTLTPAIEFGITPNICIYLGGYFTVIGRNTSSSAEGNLTLEVSF